jgi:mono/diheme cytochrome c family protein
MRSLLIGAAIWAAVSLGMGAFPAYAQQPAANLMPPGDGRDVVALACTQCHGPNVFAQLRQGSDAWRFQVYDMILRGAQVPPADVDKVVGYLVSSYGPGVNVPPPVHQVTLPDGAGKDLVESHCAVCHGLDRVATSKRGPGEWAGIVRRMAFLGAPVSADDAKTITAYLDQKFGAK